MATKLYDLVVTTGTYEKAGETKKRYLTIGSAFESDMGGMFLVLARHVNLAGLPFKDGSDSVLVSCFAPREKDAPRGSSSKPSDDMPF